MIRKYYLLVLFVLLGAFVALDASAAMSEAHADEVVAWVNGDTVTEAALESRIRKIHQFKPRLQAEGDAAGVSVREIVDGLVDDKLMVQEALRLELDRDQDVVSRMEAFVSSQAVLRLREEEVTRKIAVTELEIVGYFRERFENVEPAHQGKLERFRSKIVKILNKRKEKELAEAFVAALRGAADVRIHRDLMQECDPVGGTFPSGVAVASVNGVDIPMEAYAHDLRETMRKQRMETHADAQSANGGEDEALNALRETVLDQLLTYELVRQAAARRDFASDPEYAAMLAQRREELLTDAFRRKIVAPLAVTDEAMFQAYYEAHLDDYVVGREVRFSGMRFHDSGKAAAILEEIRQGADVDYLAREVADGSVNGGNGEWVRLDSLERPVANVLIRLATGETSDVVVVGRQFALLTLRGARGGKPLPYDKVAGSIRVQVTRDAFEKAMARYLAALRAQADVEVSEKRVAAIEALFWKAPQAEAGAGAGE